MEELRGFRRFVLPRNNARDLGFTGTLLAASVDETELSQLQKLIPDTTPGHPDTQPMAAVFQLPSGRYVCFTRRVEGMEFVFDVQVYLPDQIWQVQEFFLESGVAGKQLLRNLGENVIEEIE